MTPDTTGTEQAILDEIHERQEKVDQLAKEFNEMGFFGEIFKGGKNLKQRRILLDQNARSFSQLENIRPLEP